MTLLGVDDVSSRLASGLGTSALASAFTASTFGPSAFGASAFGGSAFGSSGATGPNMDGSDTEGTGVEGITVVNATVYPNDFALLRKISDQYHYFPKVYSRGKAANSDHYMFTEKGVPAIYFYTMGGIKAYHDIYDRSVTLPLDHIVNEFNLLVKFNAGLMGLSY